jgi:hypothetical protein
VIHIKEILKEEGKWRKTENLHVPVGLKKWTAPSN